MGESYGGCLTLHAAHELLLLGEEDQASNNNNNNNNNNDYNKNIKGILLNCPAVVGDLPPLPVVWALRYGLAPCFPTWTPSFMPHPLAPERIWKNEEARAYHGNTTNSHGLTNGGQPYCLGTAVGLLMALEQVRTKVIPNLAAAAAADDDSILPPMLCYHGTEDFGVKMEGSELLADQIKSCELVKVEGGYHDLFSGEDAEELIRGQLDWMLQQL